MRFKLARCVLPLVGVQMLAVVAGCAEQVGPSDAEVYTVINTAVHKATSGLNQVQCDTFRRELVTHAEVLVYADCEYAINSKQFEEVKEFVEMTKAMPLAFGHPMETVHRSVAAEHSLQSAEKLKGTTFNARIRYRQAVNGGWDILEATEVDNETAK